MLETIVRVASYLFLAGVVLLFSSAVPAVRKRLPRAFAAGSFMALGSFVLVLLGTLLFR